MDPGASRQLLEPPQGVAVVGGGVDQDLLGPLEQARVRNRRTGLGKPQDGGQVAEQERREQRGGVLQAGLIGGQRHPVVADADPAGGVGQLALQHHLGVEPVGAVPAQDQRP